MKFQPDTLEVFPHDWLKGDSEFKSSKLLALKENYFQNFQHGLFNYLIIIKKLLFCKGKCIIIKNSFAGYLKVYFNEFKVSARILLLYLKCSSP